MHICTLAESIWGEQELIRLLIDLDDDFNPPFRTRIESFEGFAEKLCRLGHVHVAGDNTGIMGAIGYYCNDRKTQRGYITYLGVRRIYRGKGIAYDLLEACLETMRKADMRMVTVRADRSNTRSSQFYTSRGFQIAKGKSVDSTNKEKLFFKLVL